MTPGLTIGLTGAIIYLACQPIHKAAASQRMERTRKLSAVLGFIGFLTIPIGLLIHIWS